MDAEGYKKTTRCAGGFLFAVPALKRSVLLFLLVMFKEVFKFLAGFIKLLYCGQVHYSHMVGRGVVECASLNQ